MAAFGVLQSTEPRVNMLITQTYWPLNQGEFVNYLYVFAPGWVGEAFLVIDLRASKRSFSAFCDAAKRRVVGTFLWE